MAETDFHSQLSNERPLLLVGTPDLTAPHLPALQAALPVQSVAPDELKEVITPGDFCVFLNEHSPPYREAIRDALDSDCITLLAIDGIIEWRSCWENHYPPKVWKPILCHKAACIGLSQAQVLSSWGNEEKVEVVGLPRLDAMLGRTPRTRKAGEPFRIIVMTAKNPGFTTQQIQTTEHSLKELKHWFNTHPVIESTQVTESTPVEAVWRLTQDMAERIGVENSLKDTTGVDLATALESADAVITTPSTAMLEGMLQGIPVALLDFHNTPQLTPACWTLSCSQHFDAVIPELIDPPTEKLLHQKFLLQQHLQINENATQRMVQVITTMLRVGQECLAANREYSFPSRILSVEGVRNTPDADAQVRQLQLVTRQQQQLIEGLRRENSELSGRLSRFENHPLVGRLAQWRRKYKGAGS